MKLKDWASDTIVAWFIKDWTGRNLTEKNIKSGFEAFLGWLSDPLIREAFMRILKFCLVGILNEIKAKQNEKTDSDLPEPPCA